MEKRGKAAGNKTVSAILSIIIHQTAHLQQGLFPLTIKSIYSSTFLVEYAN